MATFILGSSSPRRRDLLASLGIDFIMCKPSIDETQHDGEPPETYVQRLSREKAAAIATKAQPPAVVLAADTVVIDNGVILGKPADADEARQMLRQLRDRAHQVCTAITLYHLEGGQHVTRMTRLTCTEVVMRAYSDAEIEAYIATGDPFDKAGGYAIQHPEFSPVAQIDGSYSNVVGLPLETLRTMLTKIGWQLEAES